MRVCVLFKFRVARIDLAYLWIAVVHARHCELGHACSLMQVVDADSSIPNSNDVKECSLGI